MKKANIKLAFYRNIKFPKEANIKLTNPLSNTTISTMDTSC